MAAEGRLHGAGSPFASSESARKRDARDQKRSTSASFGTSVARPAVARTARAPGFRWCGGRGGAGAKPARAKGSSPSVESRKAMNRSASSGRGARAGSARQRAEHQARAERQASAAGPDRGRTGA
jgi:hypothetical protein